MSRWERRVAPSARSGGRPSSAYLPLLRNRLEVWPGGLVCLVRVTYFLSSVLGQGLAPGEIVPICRLLMKFTVRCLVLPVWSLAHLLPALIFCGLRRITEDGPGPGSELPGACLWDTDSALLGEYPLCGRERENSSPAPSSPGAP